jgi:hypothetical protein
LNIQALSTVIVSFERTYGNEALTHVFPEYLSANVNATSGTSLIAFPLEKLLHFDFSVPLQINSSILVALKVFSGVNVCQPIL